MHSDPTVFGKVPPRFYRFQKPKRGKKGAKLYRLPYLGLPYIPSGCNYLQVAPTRRRFEYLNARAFGRQFCERVLLPHVRRTIKLGVSADALCNRHDSRVVSAARRLIQGRILVRRITVHGVDIAAPDRLARMRWCIGADDEASVSSKLCDLHVHLANQDVRRGGSRRPTSTAASRTSNYPVRRRVTVAYGTRWRQPRRKRATWTASARRWPSATRPKSR